MAQSHPNIETCRQQVRGERDGLAAAAGRGVAEGAQRRTDAQRAAQGELSQVNFIDSTFNYNANFLSRLKSQLEVALHQHKALEGELERSRAEAEDQVENYFGNDRPERW